MWTQILFSKSPIPFPGHAPAASPVGRDSVSGETVSELRATANSQELRLRYGRPPLYDYDNKS
jgi:hypothetical protein